MRRPAGAAPRDSCSLPCAARLSKLVVRDAAPQEERQARGQFQVARRGTLIRRGTGGVVFDAKYELRTGQNALQRQLDSGYRKPPFAARFVKAHNPRRSASVTGWRYALRASAERIFRAQALPRQCFCRTAGEDSPAAGRIAGPVALNGPVIVSVWRCGCPPSRNYRPNCAGRVAAAGRSTAGPSHERNGHIVRSGRDFTRTRSRASTASPVSVGFSNSAARSSGPPMSAR